METAEGLERRGMDTVNSISGQSQPYWQGNGGDSGELRGGNDWKDRLVAAMRCLKDVQCWKSGLIRRIVWYIILRVASYRNI